MGNVGEERTVQLLTLALTLTLDTTLTLPLAPSPSPSPLTLTTHHSTFTFTRTLTPTPTLTLTRYSCHAVNRNALQQVAPMGFDQLTLTLTSWRLWASASTQPYPYP